MSNNPDLVREALITEQWLEALETPEKYPNPPGWVAVAVFLVGYETGRRMYDDEKENRA